MRINEFRYPRSKLLGRLSYSDDLDRFIHQMLRNTESETTEYCEMIYKLIKSPTFRTVLIHFVSWIYAFRSIPVFINQIPLYRVTQKTKNI